MLFRTIAPPPANTATSSITVNGRTYSCNPGGTLSVPDFDAIEITANGWIYADNVDAQARTLAATNAKLPPPLTPRFANVGTACAIPTYMDTFGNSLLAWSPHDICDDVVALAIETPNFWINDSFVEAGPGGTAAVAAWIEYPRGIYTQCTYGGALTGTIPNGGRLASDLMTIRIPRGARIRVWQRVIWAGSYRIMYVAGGNATLVQNGAGAVFGVTASATPPQASTAANANSNTQFRPSAILAITGRRSAFVLGDSRCVGIADTMSGGTTDTGEICRGLGAGRPYPMPYLSYAKSGHSLAAIIAAGSAGRANLIALAAYHSDVIFQIGINDIIGGVSLAGIQGYYSTVNGYLSMNAPNFWLTTKPPVSTGAWTNPNLSDQTTAATNSVRVAHNNWGRAYPSGYAGYFEVADAMESSRDSWLWKAPGWAADGTHGTQMANEFVRDNGFVNPAMFQ